MLNNLTKVILSGVVGAGVGSLVTYICLNKYYSKKADTEIESIRNLYSNKEIVKDYTPEEKEDEEEPIINETPEDYGSNIFTDFKFGEKVTDYTAFSKSNLASPDGQHPTDDEGENRVFTISTFEYDGDPEYEKRSIYFYADDDLFLDEDDSSECIADDGKSLGDYKNLVMDGFDIEAFKNSPVADTVFIRNEDVQIDFEIIRMLHYSM